MGRLIYVREVRIIHPALEASLTEVYRIARQSPASRLAVRLEALLEALPGVHQGAVASTAATVPVAVSAVVGTAVRWVAAWGCKEVVDVKSLSPTFVHPAALWELSLTTV